MRLSEPAFACLQIAKQMEEATRGAFCPTPAALKTQPSLPAVEFAAGRAFNSLRRAGGLNSIWAPSAKGLRSTAWRNCCASGIAPRFCWSRAAAAFWREIRQPIPPAGRVAWAKTMRRRRFFLTHASLSGSGLAVKGAHILDPRTGAPALRQNRAWVLADTAAESDALSTACMVLGEPELEEVLAQNDSWLAFLETDQSARSIGRRVPPIEAHGRRDR